HHGRFSARDRAQMDKQVSAFVGKGCPAGARFVVGTQTLEQSLDIDADLLVTDLCPMDVLLQRIGRLQRHARADRPVGFEMAQCLLLVPPGTSLLEYLDAKGRMSRTLKTVGTGSTYENVLILELTWQYFRRTQRISIPSDNRRLIEYAMHPDQ